jgi:hypothetical protein
LVGILGCLTIVPSASLYFYLNAEEQAFILIGTVEDRVRSVRVIMDYPAGITCLATTLKVLVTFLTEDSITIGADRAPVRASILDIVCAFGAEFLTGITPISSTLST